MAFYDCFIYNGEFTMLNFRLHELSSCVDRFVIAESEYTFKGDKRELRFPGQRKALEAFDSKIVYLPQSAAPRANAWDNETDLRNFLSDGLGAQKLQPEDLIMLSDVDEIPDARFLQNFRRTGFRGIGTFYQNLHYYSFHFRSPRKWTGTVFFDHRSGYLKLGFQQLRDNRHHLPKVGGDGDYTSGGWHLSYFGGVPAILEKLESFSHQEFNRSRFKDPKTIEECLRTGKDLLFRKDETFEFIEHPTYLPKFAHLLE